VTLNGRVYINWLVREPLVRFANGMKYCEPVSLVRELEGSPMGRNISVLDTTHHAAYTTLDSTLPNALYCTLPSTLPIALHCTLPVLACLTLWFQINARLHTIGHSQPIWLYALKYAPNDAPEYTRFHTSYMLHFTLPSTLLRTLDWTLPACLTVRSQVCFQVRSPLHWIGHSQPAWLYAPKYAPACTRLHTPSPLDCTLLSTLLIALEFILLAQDLARWLVWLSA